MHCRENVALENIWRQRYERATHVACGGLFAVGENATTHAQLVRECRAKQAQAANAILLHQRSCAVCGNAEHTHGGLRAESRAS